MGIFSAITCIICFLVAINEAHGECAYQKPSAWYMERDLVRLIHSSPHLWAMVTFLQPSTLNWWELSLFICSQFKRNVFATTLKTTIIVISRNGLPRIYTESTDGQKEICFWSLKSAPTYLHPDSVIAKEEPWIRQN